jgi:hypothetical protein
MKTAHCAAAIVLVLGGCDQAVGNGMAQTESRSPTGFTQVRNNTALSVTVTQAPAFSVSVSADSNLLPLITMTVSGEVLVIDQIKDLTSRLPLSATITLPTLNGIDGEGSGKLVASGVTAGAFSIGCNGSGAVSLQGNVGDLTLSSAGSGAVHLGGSATGLQATITGSGSVDGSDFRVMGTASVLLTGAGSASLAIQGNSTLDVRGAGSLTVALDGGTTNFSVAGSGSILWSGQTTLGQVGATGSGRVTKR